MYARVHCLTTVVLLWACTGPAAGEGMIAWYEFENNLDDSSRNGYTGTIAGGSPAYVPGRTGHGQAVRVTSADSIRWAGLPTSTAITVSLRVKLDPASPSGRPWLLDALAASPWRGWQFRPEKLTANTAQLRWAFADDHGNRPTTYGVANTLFDGEWHHVAGTHDGGTTATAYFDGVRVGYSNSSLFEPAPSGTPMTLNNLVQGGIYAGEIDDIIVWNRALTAAEIADLSTDKCMHVGPGPVNRYYVHGSGGSVVPAVFMLTNTREPEQALTYAVQEVIDQPWLTLSKTGGGPLAYLATDTVTATINPAGLAVGEHTCDIRFTDNCLPAEETILQVSLVVESKTQIPLVISYYDNGWMSLPATDVGYSTLAACGMNVVNTSVSKSPPIDLDLAQQYGLLGMVDWDPGGTVTIPDDPALLDARAQGLVNQYSAYPALLGYRLRDEPNANEFPQIGMLHQKLLEYDPTCLPWINILPNYSYGAYGTGVTSHKQYMDSFMTTVQPKVLCYDDYTAANNTTYPPDKYTLYWHYSNSERFREYGLAYGLPYWRIIESNLLNQSPNTEGIFRFQTYSSLAYGFTGILYFTYTQQNESDYAFVYYQGQSGLWGTPTDDGRYQTAQGIHNEIKKLGPVLLTLTSSNVRFNTPPVFPGYSYVPAEDIETFLGLSGSAYVQGIIGGTMVVGEFVDASSRRYLMFVNEDYVSTSRTFGITLKSANVPALGRVSKSTGRLVIETTPNNVLTLPLSAGNGELYKILTDTSGPSTPAGLVGAPQSLTQVFINWLDSADAQSAIAYYVVYRDGAEIGTSTSSDYTDTGLLTATTYKYEVSAVNGEGVESGKSDPIWLTTVLQPRGDFDGDGDVDQKDFGHFQTCFSGQPQTSPDCLDAILDGDDDVDQGDFAIFRGCLSGPDVPADSSCGG